MHTLGQAGGILVISSAGPLLILAPPAGWAPDIRAVLFIVTLHMTVAGALLVAGVRASLLDVRPPRLPAPLLVLGPTVGIFAVSIMAILSPESLPPLLTQATIIDEAGTLMPPRPDAGLVLLTIPSIALFAITSVGYALLYREVGRRFHAVMSLTFVLVVAARCTSCFGPSSRAASSPAAWCCARPSC